MYIIKNASLLVRANTADTYGMVVGDAIQLGTPSIASDVCPRHPGTILFKNGNSDDLSIKIKDTIENLANYKKKLKYINIENNADKLIKFYKLLLRDKL
jgi:glycosyltransferase involved in cell wall biosynthesis